MSSRLDDSDETPVKVPAAVKISQIIDRNQKLNAYRLQKNTKKFKEIQEQRSPFIVAVPVGRWVEKKERFPQQRIGLNETPVRKALMNERVLKKSTIKKLMVQSTAKKENLMVFGKSEFKPIAIKSKKQILSELNAIPHEAAQTLDDIPDLEPMDEELNTTFEISPEPKETKVEEPKESVKKLRRSRSLPEIVQKVNHIRTRKVLTPPIKNEIKKAAAKKALDNKTKPIERAVTKKVVRKIAEVKPTVVLAPTRFLTKTSQAQSQAKAKSTKKEILSAIDPNDRIETEEVVLKKTKVQKPTEKQSRSQPYTLYKSSVNIQITYLTMQISELNNNQEIFEMLTEEQQTFLHQTVQQGNLIVSEKLKKFEAFLDKFEDGLSRPEDPKRVTRDDVENYWYLIYEEIEKLKDDIGKIKEMKKSAFAVIASQKKRRTRKTYAPEDGTPKRSRRIAENADTPK